MRKSRSEIKSNILLTLLIAPKSAFRSLERGLSFSILYIFYLAILIVFPINIAIGSYSDLREELSSSDAGAVAAAPLIAVAFGFSVLVFQLALLFLNLVTFSFLSRIFGANKKGKVVFVSWMLAIFPLAFRHVFLSVLALLTGPEWYLERSGIIAFLDPFVLWSAFLLFLAAREALGVKNNVYAIIIATLSSILGVVPALLDFIFTS